MSPRSSDGPERCPPKAEVEGSSPSGGTKGFFERLLKPGPLKPTTMLVTEEDAEMLVEAGVLTKEDLQRAREKEDPMGRRKPGRLKRKGA